jgi:hypothetical protein
MGNRPSHLSCGLVLALTLIRDLPQQIVLGPSQATTISGRTQCTLDSWSGDPKRLSRGQRAAICWKASDKAATS